MPLPLAYSNADGLYGVIKEVHWNPKDYLYVATLNNGREIWANDEHLMPLITPFEIFMDLLK